MKVRSGAVVFFGAMLAVAAVVACHHDSGQPPPPPLCGDYNGSLPLVCPDASTVTKDGSVPVDAMASDAMASDAMAGDAIAPPPVDAGFPTFPTCVGAFGIDTTFGTQGIVVDPTITSEFYAVAVQPDGKIIAAGDSIVVRYNVNGTVDTTFGQSGYLTFPAQSSIGSVLVQSNGAIVLAGHSATDCILARYTATGTLDTTFGSGSPVCVAGAPGYGQTVQRPNGGFIAAGSAYPVTPGVRDYGVIQYDANGKIDTTFGTKGLAFAGFPGDAPADTVYVQPDGKILVAGEVTVNHGASPAQLGVVRFNANGTLDTTFGTGGRASFTIPHASSGGERVALQSNGRILIVADGAPADDDFSVVGLTKTGQLDTTFGTGGVAGVAFLGHGSSAVSLNVMGDDSIVVGGTVQVVPDGGTDPLPQFGVARFLASGAVDTTFGSGGTYITTIATEDQGTAYVNQALLTTGGLIAVGNGGRLNDGGSDVLNDGIVVRYACH